LTAKIIKNYEIRKQIPKILKKNFSRYVWFIENKVLPLRRIIKTTETK